MEIESYRKKGGLGQNAVPTSNNLWERGEPLPTLFLLFLLFFWTFFQSLCLVESVCAQ